MILELGFKSFHNSAIFKRKVIQKCDLERSVLQTLHFDFIVDAVSNPTKEKFENYFNDVKIIGLNLDRE
jgi:hypothetical protein